ncbi:hypothetical protein GQ54DRAFT_324716 [Martensiomyces pterosporus]|nr:hypothetical protein GQ54DRAFT_324716 [Martensiomyces pterosporus]
MCVDIPKKAAVVLLHMCLCWQGAPLTKLTVKHVSPFLLLPPSAATPDTQQAAGQLRCSFVCRERKQAACLAIARCICFLPMGGWRTLYLPHIQRKSSSMLAEQLDLELHANGLADRTAWKSQGALRIPLCCAAKLRGLC